MQIAEAFVAVRADVNQARFKADVTRGIEQPLVAGSKEAGRKAGDAAGSELDKAMQQRAQQTRQRLASLFGGALFVRGVKGAIDAASGLNEQASATGQIFGESRKQIDAFAEGAAQSLGQSEEDARKATNTFGALFRSFGTSEDQAAKFGITLDTLASDLASFRDTPIEDAFLALQSGLVGEAEPLRRFGVSLSEARLQTEALSLGLVEQGTKTLPAAAKAQAALSIILKDTKLAQGDFNRTRESAANTEKRAQAELANTSAQLGSNLLPAYQRVAEVVGQLARVFSALPAPIQLGAVAFAGLAVAARPIKDVSALVGTLRTRLISASEGSGTFGRSLTGLGTAVTGVGAAATVAVGLVAAFDQLGQEAPDIERLTSATEAFAKSGIFGGALEETFGKGAAGLKDLVSQARDAQELGKGGAGGFLGKIGATVVDPFREGATEINRAKGAFDALDKTLSDLVSGGNGDDAKELFDQLRAAAKDQGVNISDLVKLFPQYQAALSDTDLATKAGVDSTDAYNVELGKTGDEAVTTASKLRDLAAALIAPKRAAADAADALQNVRDAQSDLVELQETAAGRGPQQAAAQERIAAAERSVQDAVEDHADAVRALQHAREDLADFEGQNDARIRELERAQIVARQVDTADEARQKEIDLLRFDQNAADERERLQEGVANAEEGVEDAAQKVGDAQHDVLEANQARRDAQVKAAGEIAEAERKVNDAVLDIAESYADVVAKEGEASVGALALKGALDQVALSAAGIDPALIDALARLSAAQGAGAGTVNTAAHGTAARNIGTAKLQRFASGGFVRGSGPQLVVAEPGEQVLTEEQQAARGGSALTMVNNFHGGDVPTLTQLDATARKLAIRAQLGGRRQ